MVKFAVDKGHEQEPETQPVVLICLLPQILVGITHVHPISCKVREQQTLRKIKKNKSYGLCLQLTRINKLTAKCSLRVTVTSTDFTLNYNLLLVTFEYKLLVVPNIRCFLKVIVEFNVKPSGHNGDKKKRKNTSRATTKSTDMLRFDLFSDTFLWICSHTGTDTD